MTNTPAWMDNNGARRQLSSIELDGSNVQTLSLHDLPPRSMPGIIRALKGSATQYIPTDYCMNGDGTNGRVFTSVCPKPPGVCHMKGHPDATDGTAGRHFMTPQQRAAFLHEAQVTHRYV